MLTIVTGTPGAGKTLFTLWKIWKEFREKVPPEEWRPIFINGVPDLEHSFFASQPLEDPEAWYELPEGSIIFIDEGQRVFPQRPASAAVPVKCRQFETHRHRGYDVFVTTQDANTLDVHLRRLCGRHFFLKRTLGQELATLYEYDEYTAKPTDFHSKKGAISTAPWKYPKEFYARYKSATLHTVKKRFPLRLFIVPVALVGVVLLGYFAVTSIGSSIRGDAVDPAGVPADSSPGLGQLPDRSRSRSEPLTREEWIEQYTPLVPGVLHSAPIYAEVTKPETFPRPYCIMIHDKRSDPWKVDCRCYTQQVTKYETSYEFCRFWAESGFFDSTREEDSNQDWGGRQSPPGLTTP